MARINNLTNFLNDVSSAIKEKLGDNTPIPASQFDTKIASIETGGNYQQKSITISSNGTQIITPDENYDAIEQLTITTSVPVYSLQTKSVQITSNGNISILPDTGYNGMTQVDLIVNVPTGQEINNQDKTITQNGQYTANSGYTGLGTVTVNVPSSGDIPVKLFNSVEEMNRDSSAQEGDLAVVYADDSQPYDGTSPVTSFYFPSTVTLSESGTGSASGWGILQVECNVSSSSADFNFDDGGDISYNITYTSSDGLTYTRTDGGEDVITISETPMSLELMGWSDICGNFMRVSSKAFEGLYEYNSTNNKYEIITAQLDTTSDYVYEKTFYGKNGVEIGSLQNNSNLSKDELRLRVNVWNSLNNLSLDDSITSLGSFFENNKNLISIPNIDTSNVTDMGAMFRDCSALISIPNIDTSNVTDMGAMFNNCNSLKELPKLDTSNVTNMTNMLSFSSTITIVPQLDTSKVTVMPGMFRNCSSLVTIPILNTEKVTNMRDMFVNCESLDYESLNNILVMCTNSTVTSNKTLKYIGLTQEQAQICTTLSNYSAFTAAGWTTGY